MRRWWWVLVACVAAAVAVPVTWAATRPSPSDGVSVVTVGQAPPVTPSSAAASAPGRTSLPTLTARPASPGAPTRTAAPRRLVIASVGVDARVAAVGVDAAGAMVVPKEVDEVGWYRYGSAPGAPAGAAVVTGHVDSAEAGAGALFPLRTVEVGAVVEVTAGDGRLLRYRVVGKETFDKQRLPVERLFARDGAPRLVLITCGGPFDAELASYRDNLVVVAVPEPGAGGTP